MNSKSTAIDQLIENINSYGIGINTECLTEAFSNSYIDAETMEKLLDCLPLSLIFERSDLLAGNTNLTPEAYTKLFHYPVSRRYWKLLLTPNLNAEKLLTLLKSYNEFATMEYELSAQMIKILEFEDLPSEALEEIYRIQKIFSSEDISSLARLETDSLRDKIANCKEVYSSNINIIYVAEHSHIDDESIRIVMSNLINARDSRGMYWWTLSYLNSHSIEENKNFLKVVEASGFRHEQILLGMIESSHYMPEQLVRIFNQYNGVEFSNQILASAYRLKNPLIDLTVSYIWEESRQIEYSHFRDLDGRFSEVCRLYLSNYTEINITGLPNEYVKEVINLQGVKLTDHLLETFPQDYNKIAKVSHE